MIHLSHHRPFAARAQAGRRKAKPAAFRFDRTSALGLGMLLGLAAVFLDRAGVGHGRAADTKPVASGGRGWMAVLRRTFHEFNDDRVPAVAAGATFFALLALFPALGVFVSLYGLFADVEVARRQILALSGLLPEGGVTVLSEQLTRLAAAPHASLGLTFALSLVLSIWSSNAGMKGVIAGLNIAYETSERRNFVKLNLVSLAFTACAIVLAIVAVTTVAATPRALTLLHLSNLQGLALLRWPVLLVVLIGLFSVLYRYGPNRPEAPWRWITPGGAFAAVAWIGMSLAFSLYVGRFGHYDKTYGSLGAVVGFMTWIWLSLIVLLLGAEFNSELEKAVGTQAMASTHPPRWQEAG